MATEIPGVNEVIVRREKEVEIAPQTGSRPVADTLRYIPEATGNILNVQRVFYPEKVESGPRRHRGVQVLLFVEQGYGTLVVDDQEVALIPATMVVVPPGFTYNLIGDYAHEHLGVLCIYIVAPGHENDPIPMEAS